MHLDPRAVHVHDQTGDALLAFGGVGITAGQAQAPVGELGIRGPYFGPRQHPAPLGPLGPGGQRGQIAARLGLGEQLAPERLGPEDRRQPLLALGRCAVGQQGRRHQVDSDAPYQLGGPGPGHLLGDQKVLSGSEPATAEFDRPGDAHPPVGSQFGLPGPPEGHHLVEIHGPGGRFLSVGPREIGHQPLAQLGL
jgi:hypothetical protein